MFKHTVCIAFAAAMALGTAVAAQPSEQEQREHRQQANGQLNALSSDLAKALNHPGFRGLLRAEIARVRNPEKILKLDDLLGKARGGPSAPPGAQKLIDASRRTGSHFGQGGSKMMSGLDLYFPVTEHAQKWKGGVDFLVAFAPVHNGEEDFNEFVTYSVKTGQQVRIDAKQPPEIPVLVIAPEEHETHDAVAQPARVERLGTRKPDWTQADPAEQPVPQDPGNSYVGPKYLRINETKEWWWEGYPEIYLLFGQIKDGSCEEKKLFVSEVNRADVWYNLWSRSSPARWYFDENYWGRMVIIPMERDAGGYTKLRLDEPYVGRTCEWTIRSEDDAFQRYTMFRNNLDFNRDYYQINGLFGSQWIGWRKEH